MKHLINYLQLPQRPQGAKSCWKIYDTTPSISAPLPRDCSAPSSVVGLPHTKGVGHFALTVVHPIRVRLGLPVCPPSWQDDSRSCHKHAFPVVGFHVDMEYRWCSGRKFT